jgi:broad specificity phosphatase PhoE
MRTGHRLSGLLVVLAALLFCGGAASADEVAALEGLRAGGHVALMRHAEAPGGAGDPPGFRLEDCATQRNLSAKGRADAGSVGRRLKAERIAVTRLVSSPWCRCIDTARLMDLGTIEIDHTFGNVVVWRDRREALAAGARDVINQWRGPGTLLVVTHGANIQALIGGYNPGSGEIVVVAPGGSGMLREIGRLPVPAG